MALDIPLPWLRGPNTLEALSSGASAGAAAGRLESENVNESARIALEAMRMRQGAAMEAARLRQADTNAQMEFQAQQKTQEQNQLRESQRLNIENAYKTAQLGIAKGRLEQQQKVADDKARDAAMTFRDEQGFAQHLASGGTVLDGLRRFPRVGSSYLSAVERATRSPQPKDFNTSEGIIRVNPDGTPILLYGTKDSKGSLLKALSEGESKPSGSGQMWGGIGMLRNKLFGSGNAEADQPPSAPSKFGYPKIGEVRDGHRFKGGDPNDSKNWEIVNKGQ